MSLKILYFAMGTEGSTSMMKARAFERLGHRVTVVNLYHCLPRNIWLRRLNNFSGYVVWQSAVERFLRQRMPQARFDVAWVDSGQLLGPKLVASLRSVARKVVNYNHDDPTGTRDGRAWGSFKRAVPAYDALVTVRRETEAELLALGAKQVLRVWRSFDEVDHRPWALSAEEQSRWASEVLFVGTWMRERGEFFTHLVRLGVPLTIYGDHWSKAPQWLVLRPYFRGPAVYGADYARAIQAGKVSLGLLSKANRDLHTTRSAEIPALGALLCAERTAEHSEMYVEGSEAVFWSGAEECAQACAALLADEPRRRAIAAAGQRAVWARGFGNECVLDGVLRKL